MTSTTTTSSSPSNHFAENPEKRALDVASESHDDGDYGRNVGETEQQPTLSRHWDRGTPCDWRETKGLTQQVENLFFFEKGGDFAYSLVAERRPERWCRRENAAPDVPAGHAATLKQERLARREHGLAGPGSNRRRRV